MAAQSRAWALSFLIVVCIAFEASSGTVEPNWQACSNDVSKALPYCDTTLSHAARVEDLLGRLSTADKVGVVSPFPGLNTCPVVTRAIESVGLPEYMWLEEVNTGADSACMGPNKCSTTFPGPEGLGASFNRTVWYQKGDVISSELRAYSNSQWYRAIGTTANYGKYKIGLDGFGPNMNIVRDPRFGRNSELPGEDPFLTGSYAVNFVKGMQQVDSKGYIKMLAYLKHFDAYSREANRMHGNNNITLFTFWDTYLPAYQMAFTDGQASGAMCSYESENGHPSCANGYLLNEVVRGKWGRADAVIMTDCGAVQNMLGAPLNAPSTVDAAAWSINNGTDIEAGSTVWNASMVAAVEAGLVKEATLDTSVSRAMMNLMRAGRFDPPEMVSWTSITSDVVNSTEHQRINYDAALQSIILLKNDGALPLAAGANVAVLGPQGSSRYGMISDYAGDELCYVAGQPHNGGYACIYTIAEALALANQGGKVSNASGVDINSQDKSRIPAALALGREADVIVLALGIDKTIEHEGVDRTSITLPGLQEPFAQQVLALGKPTVLVLVNGGEVAIDTLMSGPNAIVEAFNPNTVGTQALAATLVGKANRWGKMPITMYPGDYVDKISMNDYHMAPYNGQPGRSYRYYAGPVLFPFGWGMSYTSFSLACAPAVTNAGEANTFPFECTVTNTGSVGGDEVVLVYHAAGDAIRRSVSHPVPIKQLVEFQRLSLDPGASATVTFSLGAPQLQLTNTAGDKVVYPGLHQFIFSRGIGTDVAFNVTAS